MVSGKKPFRGETPTSTIAKILEVEPEPLDQTHPELNSELIRIIRRCLRKKPGDRYNDTRDLVVALKDLKQDTSSTQYQMIAAAARKKRVRSTSYRAAAIFLGIAVIIAGAAFGWLYWLHSGTQREAPPKSEITFRQLTANPSENFINGAAISPDGKYLIYSDNSALYLLSIGTGEIRSLTITDAASLYGFAWFPDGTRILMTKSGKVESLWSYSLMTGANRKLRDDACEPSVSPDGSFIAFNDEDYEEIWIMRADGAEPRKIVQAEEKGSASYPVWSPDGNRVAWAASHPKKGGEYADVIESADPQGKQSTMILSDPKLSSIWALCWLRDGRILFIQGSSDPYSATRESSLWEIKVDPRSGRSEGQPRKLTTSTGSSWDTITATVDGKRLACLGGRGQHDVYVGDLEANGTRMTEPRRLTLDDRNDYLSGWTSDSRSVLFNSNRNGTNDIFKQDLDSRSAEMIFASPDQDAGPCLTPDGSSILFWQFGAGEPFMAPDRLMRLPLSGGAPEMVFDGKPQKDDDQWSGVRCTGMRCIISHVFPKKLIVFHEMDPIKGPGRELAKINIDAWGSQWDLSPDGTRIVIAEYGRGVRIVSLLDSTISTVPVKEIEYCQSACWSQDGKSLYITGWKGGICKLLSVTLEGESNILWERSSYVGRPLPSPDGRHLALQVVSGDFNAWMIENF